jgi:hypothetical protein
MFIILILALLQNNNGIIINNNENGQNDYLSDSYEELFNNPLYEHSNENVEIIENYELISKSLKSNLKNIFWKIFFFYLRFD